MKKWGEAVFIILLIFFQLGEQKSVPKLSIEVNDVSFLKELPENFGVQGGFGSQYSFAEKDSILYMPYIRLDRVYRYDLRTHTSSIFLTKTL